MLLIYHLFKSNLFSNNFHRGFIFFVNKTRNVALLLILNKTKIESRSTMMIRLVGMRSQIEPPASNHIEMSLNATQFTFDRSSLSLLLFFSEVGLNFNREIVERSYKFSYPFEIWDLLRFSGRSVCLSMIKFSWFCNSYFVLAHISI